MNYVKNPWLGGKLLDYLRGSSLSTDDIMRYLQVIDIYSRKDNFGEVYVSDSQYYILAHVHRNILSPGKVNMPNFIKGGIISISRYEFAYSHKSQSFILKVLEYDYHGGEGDIIKNPTDINSSAEVKRLFYSALYELKSHEILALMESYSSRSPRGGQKKRKVAIREDNPEKKCKEIATQPIEHIDKEEIFDMSLQNIKFTQPFCSDSYENFSFLDLKKERERKELFDTFCKFCQLRNVEISEMDYFDVSTPPDGRYEEMLFEFTFEYSQMRFMMDITLFTRSLLSMIDPSLCSAIIRLFSIKEESLLFSSVFIMLKDSKSFPNSDYFYQFAYLKLIFIKLMIILNKPLKILTLFRWLKGKLPNLCTRNLEIRSFLAGKTTMTNRIKSKKYNPINEGDVDLGSMAYTLKMKFIEERSSKKIKFEDKDTISLNKLEKKMLRSNTHKKESAVQEDSLDMNSIVDIEAGEYLISSFPSSFTSPCVNTKEDTPSQPTCSTCISFIDGVYNILDTQRIMLTPRKCYCDQLINLYNLNFEDKQNVPTNRNQRTKDCEIQEFVERTSLDLALLLIDENKKRKPAKLKRRNS